MRRKEHLTEDGLRKIVAIRASMNWDLSDVLKKAFPYIVPVVRPLVENPKILDRNWLAGFTTGEGCFSISIKKSQTNSVGYQVILVFQIAQHSRDELLLVSIIKYWNCGIILKYSLNAVVLKVTKFDDIINKVIPFFQKHPIHGVKALDFADWCQVAEMMKQKNI